MKQDLTEPVFLPDPSGSVEGPEGDAAGEDFRGRQKTGRDPRAENEGQRPRPLPSFSKWRVKFLPRY